MEDFEGPYNNPYTNSTLRQLFIFDKPPCLISLITGLQDKKIPSSPLPRALPDLDDKPHAQEWSNAVPGYVSMSTTSPASRFSFISSHSMLGFHFYEQIR